MAKKHGVTDVKHADLHQDEELHVTRTTPQGTQEAGVDKGHEQRDIKIRSMILWFTGLTIGTIITVALMVLMVWAMMGRDRVEKTRTASRIYSEEYLQRRRRKPELLPNPQQPVYTLPWEHRREFVKQENEKLKAAGLEDEWGRPALPVAVVNDVVREPSSGVAYQDEKRPSEATGGLGEDNAILTR